MCFTWLPGVIPWSSATHVELGMWVRVSGTGVPKLIASRLCISQGSGADKAEVVTAMVSRTWSRGKRKHFDIRGSENCCGILSLWFTFIIYHDSKPNRLIVVFLFSTALPSLPGVRGCCPANCMSCDPELVSHPPKPSFSFPAGVKPDTFP